ncbi:MAG: peptidylprolyl isomerase [Gammaproteobacteria bacterium]
MRVVDGTVVQFHYVLKNGQGDVLDESGAQVFSYLHGHGNIVAGLERAMEGRAAGDRFDVEVAPRDGYGELDQGLIQRVPRTAFGGNEVDIGMRFTAESDRGRRVVTVTAVDTDSVTVDGNHPLAGQTLHFAVEVANVREATGNELAHGHVHDGDDHHH